MCECGQGKSCAVAPLTDMAAGRKAKLGSIPVRSGLCSRNGGLGGNLQLAFGDWGTGSIIVQGPKRALWSSRW